MLRSVSFGGAVLLTVVSMLTWMNRDACPAADAPAAKLVINKAMWGDPAGEKTIDVTEKVAKLVKDDSLSVAANELTLGKTPGARKLKVSYTVDGIYRTKSVDDGETLDISTKLVILKAVYGSLPNGQKADVTEQVADLVKKNSLSVEASNELFGDTAAGVVKSLRVDYLFDGVKKSKMVKENQTLKISDKGE